MVVAVQGTVPYLRCYRWHTPALLIVLAACADATPQHAGVGDSGAATPPVKTAPVATAPMIPASAHDSAPTSSAPTEPSGSVDCFRSATYYVRNLRDDELTVDATPRYRDPTTTTVPPSQTVLVLTSGGLTGGTYHMGVIDCGGSLSPSGDFSAFRVSAGREVICEGVNDADWQMQPNAWNSFVLVIPRSDVAGEDAGTDADAGDGP
jgi:hypothetical protein